MTTTLEETTLAERHSDYILPGLEFPILTGFRATPADLEAERNEGAITVGNYYNIYVTGVDAASDSGNRPDPDNAELLVGRILSARLHRTDTGLTWFCNSSLAPRISSGDPLRIPAAFLHGVRVRIESPTPEDGLIAVREREDRILRADDTGRLQVVHSSFEADNPMSMVHTGRFWVPVTPVDGPAEESAEEPAAEPAAEPFSIVPEGVILTHDAEILAELRRSSDMSEKDVLVTGWSRTENPSAVTDPYVNSLKGKVLPLRASMHNNNWFVTGVQNAEFEAAGGGGRIRYLEGAMVNPDLRSGDRLLLSDGRVAQWSIAGMAYVFTPGTGPSVVTASSLPRMTAEELEAVRYVRVTVPDEWTMPEGTTPAPAEAAPAEVAEPEAPRTHYMNTRGRTSPLLGMAGEDRPVIDMPLVPGETYIAWSKEWQEGVATLLFTYLGEIPPVEGDHEEAGSVLTYKASLRCDTAGRLQEATYWGGDHITEEMLRRDYHFTRYVAVPREAAVPDSGQGNPMLAHQLSELNERRETYIEKLNEMAADADWCSEYEAVMQAVGLPGRTKKTGDFYVTVSARFEYSNSSPSSAFDKTVSSELTDGDIGLFEMSNVSISGTGEVRIYVSDVEYTQNEDGDTLTSALMDRIDSGDVEAALAEAFQYGGSFDVDEYDYVSHDEA